MTSRALSAGLGLVVAAVVAATPASAANIVELWDQAKAPPPTKLKPATVKTATTALLILDIVQNSCNQKRRPRCVESVPAMAKFLAKARSAGMPVVFSIYPSASRDSILAPVKPMADEPMVSASVDKFYGTELDAILKAKGVDTVIVCGTSAYGAVLYTATAAAQHGYKVVLPVDCGPGGSLYEEQMTVFGLTAGPGSARATTATTLDDIKIE